MAKRTIFFLLVDGRHLDCCLTRREKLERLFPVIEMGYEERSVTTEELAHCQACGMPCLYERG